MHHRPALSLLFVLGLIFLLLSACTPEGDSLALTDYQNPEGLYTLQIPKGWSADYDTNERMLKLTPPDAKGAEGELQVQILVVAVTDPDTDIRLEQIKRLFSTLP